MHHKNSRHALFLTAMALASSAFAQSGEPAKETVVRCVDTGGHVTLTDEPCPQGETARTAAPAAKTIVADHYPLPASEVHHKAWARVGAKAGPKSPLPHRISPDVATLKAARETMLMAQSNRQQRLAGLN